MVVVVAIAVAVVVVVAPCLARTAAAVELNQFAVRLCPACGDARLLIVIITLIVVAVVVAANARWRRLSAH
jgi:uncharacterized protein YqhQ